MFPGVNPKQMQGMLKKMGISQDEVPSEKVIIEKSDGDKIIIENPSVLKVKMQGQETFQISGDISEVSGTEESNKITEQDIEAVMEQTGCKREIAEETLKKNNGDLAETILELTE